MFVKNPPRANRPDEEGAGHCFLKLYFVFSITALEERGRAWFVRLQRRRIDTAFHADCLRESSGREKESAAGGNACLGLWVPSFYQRVAFL